VPEFLSKFILSSLHKEVAHLFGDNITDTAEDECEVHIDSLSNLFDELDLSGLRPRVGDKSFLLGFVLRVVRRKNYIIFSSLVLLEIHIVGEDVILLSLNDRSNHFESHCSALRKDAHDNFHDLWLKHGESSENSRQNFVSHNFQLGVDILYEVKGGLT
jgi:hypothetical protein